ncbi:hypothetical protein [Leucobacter sp. USHLN153]|uniref:hypothetical protein n=1 Tax=Leucobacter sp. USHLN153 TaxID=3081268 RepID=UPI003015FEF4
MRIRTEFEALCTAEQAWRALHDPAVAAELYAPLLVMRPEGGFPTELATGSEVRVRLMAFGAVPVGAQLISITDLEPSPPSAWPKTMRDHGEPAAGPLALLTEWRHEITISRSLASANRAVWTDELHIGGAIAPLFRPVLALMWRWRGRKLRRLAAEWGATGPVAAARHAHPSPSAQ